MKLFERKKVAKFISKLSTKQRGASTLYDNKCEKEIFVRRLGRLFKNKYLIYYNTSEIKHWCFTYFVDGLPKYIPSPHKKYLKIINVRYYLGYSEEIEIKLIDASNFLEKGSFSVKIHVDLLYNLEGDWNLTDKEFKGVLDLFELTIPEQEFEFKVYDFNKKIKRKKSSPEDYAEIVKVKAQTYNLAYEEACKKYSHVKHIEL